MRQKPPQPALAEDRETKVDKHPDDGEDGHSRRDMHEWVSVS
jgi:hypothetical protein